ncbi:MAG: hypothetical protein ACKOYN_01035 [Planctomycetota bacterium]
MDAADLNPAQHAAPDAGGGAATPRGAGQDAGVPTEKQGRPDPIETGPAVRAPSRPLTRWERLEAWLSRLSIRNNFWHSLFSLVWLPYAFRSGIRMGGMKKLSTERFTAILPFRRFNRNFYDAMAGAALLGNSEVAAGMYLFSICGGDYTVVCKEMKYRFLRPCLGPAVYRVVKSEDVGEKLVAGSEFNVALELEIYQQAVPKVRQELLVGRCDIVFHCTPKTMMRERAEKRRARHERKAAQARQAAEATG